MLKINKNKCNACDLCKTSCAFGAIAVENDVAKVNELCTLCGACVNVCPQNALVIEHRKVAIEGLSNYSGVLIWAECASKGETYAPKRVAYELLT